MSIKYATWNIQLRQKHANQEAVDALQEFLANVVWNADGEELAFIPDEQCKMVRMGIPYEDDSPLALVEAAALLGICEAEYREAKLDYGFGFWKSVNAEDGGVIETAHI